MKLSIAIAFIALCLLPLTISCGKATDVVDFTCGLDRIILSVVDSEERDLLDMNSEPHYDYSLIKAYYVDTNGEKQLIYDSHDAHYGYGFYEEYNRYALNLCLDPLHTISGWWSAVVVEWSAEAKPDTIATLWEKKGRYTIWKEIYINGEQVHPVGEGTRALWYLDYVKDR
jgi:hypothetical protein